MSEPTNDPALVDFLDGNPPLPVQVRQLKERVDTLEKHNERLRLDMRRATERLDDLDGVSLDELQGRELTLALVRFGDPHVHGGNLEFARKALGMNRVEMATHLSETAAWVRSIEGRQVELRPGEVEIVARLLRAKLDELREYRAAMPTLRREET